MRAERANKETNSKRSSNRERDRKLSNYHILTTYVLLTATVNIKLFDYLGSQEAFGKIESFVSKR